MAKYTERFVCCEWKEPHLHGAACCRRGSIHLIPSTGLETLEGGSCDLCKMRTVQWQNTIGCLWSEDREVSVNKQMSAMDAQSSGGSCYNHSNPHYFSKVLFFFIFLFDLYCITLADRDVTEIYFSKYVPWDCLWIIWVQAGNSLFLLLWSVKMQEMWELQTVLNKKGNGSSLAGRGVCG